MEAPRLLGLGAEHVPLKTMAQGLDAAQQMLSRWPSLRTAVVTCMAGYVLVQRTAAPHHRGGGGGGGGGGAAGMVVEVWRREGVRGFYRGFLPAYARIGPTIFIQMPLAEVLRSALGVQAL